MKRPGVLDRAIVAFLAASGLVSCASSEPQSPEILVLTGSRERLAGCSMVGMIGAGEGEYEAPGGVSPRVRAEVTNAGGNVVFVDSEGTRTHDEIWSCPVDAARR